MKIIPGQCLRAMALAAALLNGFTATAQSADPGWPRVFKQDKQQLTVYQPQVDYWHGYTKRNHALGGTSRASAPASTNPRVGDRLPPVTRAAVVRAVAADGDPRAATTERSTLDIANNQ